MSPTAIAREVSTTVGIPSPASNHQSRIRTGDLVIDLETQVVTADRVPVPLTGKEYSKMPTKPRFFGWFSAKTPLGVKE